MKVFIFESLQESTVAVLRVFTPTANSPVMGVGRGTVHAYLWMYMRGRAREGARMRALGCVPCAIWAGDLVVGVPAPTAG